VIQIRTSDRGKVFERLEGLPVHVIGSPNPRDELRFVRNASRCRRAARELERAWSEVTFRMQQLRDEPIARRRSSIEFSIGKIRPDGRADVRSRRRRRCAFIAKGARPKVAILREQESTGRSKWLRRSIGPDSTRTTFT